MKAIWIVEAKYVSNYSIYLVFNDGTKGEVDLSNKLVGPIFTPLKSMDLFKEFRINSWTLEWPNGADLAPEFLYDLVAEKVTL
jgi:hypothetical protein